jgi:hypothetical protein
VPIGDLAPFLRFEGILDNDYELKENESENKRRYDILKVAVQLYNPSRGREQCFTLIGRCTVCYESKRRKLMEKHRDKLADYVRTAIKGAVDFKINTVSFQDDLNWVENSR